MGSRAQYAGISLDITEVNSLLYFLPIFLLQYLFEPFPWRSLTFVDYVLILENIMRAVFLFFAIRGIFKLPSELKKIIFFLFVCFLSTELIWAVGTTNWGTASRHHVPSMAILLLLGLGFQHHYKKENL